MSGNNNFAQYKGRSGLTAAAGYTNFRDTIQHPIYSNIIIANTYKNSVVPAITTGNFLDGLKQCGSSIGFKVEQKIKVFDYQENMTLDSQAPEICWRWLDINKAKYFNVKIDRVTEKTTCNFREMANGFCENAGKSLKEKLDPEILLEMAAASHPANRGNNAGCHKDIQMGTPSEPVEITPLNFVDKLLEAQLLFTDSANGSHWEDGKMKVVLPNHAKRVLDHRDSGVSGYSVYCCSTQDSTNYDPTAWQLIFSNNVPRVKLPDGRVGYYVIFAHEEATGFVQQIEECEVKDSEKSFGRYYRGLWVYGNGTLIPEGIAVGFFVFTTNT